MDRAVSGARVLTGGVFECDITHRRSVAVICMPYKIRCNPVHPHNGALPGLYTLCSGYTSVYLCATSLQNLAVQRTFIPLSVSLWNDLADAVFDVVGLAGFKSRANAFFIGLSCCSIFIGSKMLNLPLLALHC